MGVRSEPMQNRKRKLRSVAAHDPMPVTTDTSRVTAAYATSRPAQPPSALARVAIHPTQFPEAVRAELIESLRSREINHKFHYDSVKQTRKWLALHEAYSPARTDPECLEVYRHSFSAVLEGLPTEVHVVGLGCGGGQKDVALLRVIKESGRTVSYTPCDVGVPMVLVARQAALAVLPATDCFPLVCDLATTTDLAEALDKNLRAGTPRLFTFFGMLPNFEPDVILPKLAGLLCGQDRLLVSANLAPGTEYAAGVERVLPLYDNDLTRDWLLTFLLDLGAEKTDGEVLFGVEEVGRRGLRRIIGRFEFRQDRVLEVESQRFEFHSGDSIRLFFSYRHTPRLVKSLLGEFGLRVEDQWVTASGEEGVFLVEPVR
jgi:L-histidine Nalpha-methyltransferase